MRVLIANKFTHHVGGVETYVEWLAGALPSHDVEIAIFGMAAEPPHPAMDFGRAPVFRSPRRTFAKDAAFAERARSGVASVWSRQVARAFEAALDNFQPDLVHFHGVCYQLTPAVAHVLHRRGVASVLTAHEYKLLCANQRLWDDRAVAPCHKCVHASAVQRSLNILSTGCMRGGRAASVLGALEQPISDYVWRRSKVVIHAPSQYMRGILRQSGWPAERVHFLDLPWGESILTTGPPKPRNRLIYIGRLEPEKGVDRLIRTWISHGSAWPSIELEIWGDGSDLDGLRRLSLASGCRPVTFHGRYERHALNSILSGAVATVHPSLWDENSPFAVRESLLHGVPAIVSDRGGLPEMVSERTGTVFNSDTRESLAEGIAREVGLRRAGTSQLIQAVDLRRVSGDAHMASLLELYNHAVNQGGGN
jgi:glycosyltransferase involved in cell wall biosynthesis